MRFLSAIMLAAGLLLLPVMLILRILLYKPAWWRVRRYRLAYGIACTLAGVLWAAVTHAQEHPGDFGFHHAMNHDWYKDLHQNGTGYSCCNNEDCRPTRAELQPDGTWKALIDGKWTPIPPSVVLPTTLNKDPLHAHVCASRSGTIYCFLGAGNGS